MQGLSGSPTPGTADRAAGATQQEIETFFGVLRDFHTVPHLVSDAKETVETIKEVVRGAEPRSVVAAGLPPAAKMLVESALKGTNHRFVEDLKPGEAVAVISKADAGITWAQYGAAQQGCIVEVAYDDAVKLSSSLPALHVALLSSKNLLPDLPTAVSRVGDLLRSGDEGERKPVISIISGPSKTADIEMRLVYGVHGPHALHLLLLDWL